MQNMPRIVIAGTHSGVGKTTLATALMACLTGRGLRVQPFKVGPDYIDPGYHNAATGRVSRNLDCWMLGEETVREVFIRSASGADLSVIEGVMGLYDGRGATSSGSSAHVANLLKAPVLLVLDVRSMARSAAAVVLGFQHMDPGVKICGVLLNRVGSLRHYNILKEAIETTCDLPVVGYVRRQAGIELPERHLGLLPTSEKSGLADHIGKLAKAVEEGVDPERIISLAKGAGICPAPSYRVFPDRKRDPQVRIGLVRDQAFTFYYQDGLDLLEALGAELVECSPLKGEGLPGPLHGLYIGGGFPEMFLQDLSRNERFKRDLGAAANSGMPIYAECGGLMFLAAAIVDFEGNEYPAAGLLPGCCRMEKKRAALGYVTATSLQDNILCSRGTSLRGHEFHYSTLELSRQSAAAYLLTRWGDEPSREDGVVMGNLLASYVHLHFAGCPGAAQTFIKSCEAFKKRQLLF